MTGLEYLLETIPTTAFQTQFRHPVRSARRQNGILAIRVQRHTLVVRVIPSGKSMRTMLRPGMGALLSKSSGLSPLHRHGHLFPEAIAI